MSHLRTLFLTLLITGILALVLAFVLVPDALATVWERLGLPPTWFERIETALGRAPVTEPGGIRLYGVLEATETYVMSELSGRIAEVWADEGDWVEAGQPLLRLDGSETAARLTAAQAAVAAAQAAETAAAAPPQATTLALAAARVTAAETRLEAARRSLEQARRRRDEPLALEGEIATTREAIPAAQAAVERARADVARLEVLLAKAQEDGSREGQYQQRILSLQHQAAEAQVEAAQARLEGLQRRLALLLEQRREPLLLEAQLHAAEQEVLLAEAELALARAEAAQASASPQPEAVAVAAARVQAAIAARRRIEWEQEKLTVTAPMAGRIAKRLRAVGETVAAGEPLFILMDPRDLEVSVFVAVADLPRVHLGQELPVEVAVPGGPRLTAVVTFIATEARFRPGNVLDPQDRGDMVFAVRLRLPNPDLSLKPGMPVDVVLP
ncbi:MAG: efflux RND transporter periplasmic adaptor subunit [Anaerolineae bacterium]|nr:HlyD family secretion protein [Caldilineales bacterium]MCX7852983.1 HlyD family secretion protein [Caldilineales bacterium]MDW8267961.1 efflux RND transporter periplasmic adaptor subunit [Anaerolineae bacterium]